MFGDLELLTANLLDGSVFQERVGVEMGWKLVEDSVRKGKRGDRVSWCVGHHSSTREGTLTFNCSLLLILPPALLVVIVLWRLAISAQNAHYSQENGDEATQASFPVYYNGQANGSHEHEHTEPSESNETDPLLPNRQLKSSHSSPRTLESPIENVLLRFKFLLYLKVSLALCTAAVLLVLGVPTTSDERPGVGYIISAGGMLLAGWLSYKTHETRWTTDLGLQSVFFVQAVVIGYLASLEWVWIEERDTRRDMPEFEVLMFGSVLSLMEFGLEAISRITKGRLKTVCAMSLIHHLLKPYLPQRQTCRRN